MGDKFIFGWELLLTLEDCNVSTFTRKSLTKYFKEVCILVKMEREDLHFWDYEGVPKEELADIEAHLLGVSAVQFIKTSNITIHTLTKLGRVYMNLFSCKRFNHEKAVRFTKDWFRGDVKTMALIMRD